MATSGARGSRTSPATLSEEDLIPEVDVLVTLTDARLCQAHRRRRLSHAAPRRPGLTGMTMREEDAVQHILSANTMDWLLVFTNRGKVYQLKVHECPMPAAPPRACRSST